MGLIPKHVLEELKREKREAKAAKKRKENIRPKIVRFLIVCEGSKTEPNYFKSLVRDRFSTVREEEIIGEGKSTCALVKRTRQIKEDLELRRQLPFDRVWVVFDKDDFHDFNEAINLAQSYGFYSAWTNEAFELWYLLHFQYLNAAVGRKNYIASLQAEIRKHPGWEKFIYQKNDPNMYHTLSHVGNEAFAKSNAQKLRLLFVGNDYKTHQPCTMVDRLVEELEHPEKLL